MLALTCYLWKQNQYEIRFQMGGLIHWNVSHQFQNVYTFNPLTCKQWLSCALQDKLVHEWTPFCGFCPQSQYLASEGKLQPQGEECHQMVSGVLGCPHIRSIYLCPDRKQYSWGHSRVCSWTFLQLGLTGSSSRGGSKFSLSHTCTCCLSFCPTNTDLLCG